MAQKCTDCGRKRKGSSRAAKRRGGHWTCGTCIQQRKSHRVQTKGGSVRRQGEIPLSEIVAKSNKANGIEPQLPPEKRVDREIIASLIGKGLRADSLWEAYVQRRKEAGFSVKVRRRSFDNYASEVRRDIRAKAESEEKQRQALIDRDDAEQVPEIAEPEEPTGLDALFDEEVEDDEPNKHDSEQAAIQAVSVSLFDESGNLASHTSAQEAPEVVSQAAESDEPDSGVISPPEEEQVAQEAPEASDWAVDGDMIGPVEQLTEDYERKMAEADERIRLARLEIAKAEEDKRQMTKRLRPRIDELKAAVEVLKKVQGWRDEEDGV